MVMIVPVLCRNKLMKPRRNRALEEALNVMYPWLNLVKQAPLLH